ncbi:6-phosphogluconolactonase [Rhodoblastus sp. 17X3]|uniref:6-phosphogluconolactonase n=1 Tax=Rhodoblastus sp. 17X3 TaxID=3047026 RepID=UPI0024B81CB6|nr:6-phosphogluconolactonase [Rhodoblastus sp. 17X3]MDI9846465.1 6-phosphogluconolactonase [Rhodoblastus sp. 17X3]
MSESRSKGPTPVALRTFETSEALASALARRVAAALAERLQTAPRAILAVSGGSTPLQFFEALSAQPIDWGAVDITLVDERWVGELSGRSNARLVRNCLLRGGAAAARFIPLTSPSPSPEGGIEEVAARIDALSFPLAVAVLGMGEDGHTASFFPNGDGLAEALNPSTKRKVAIVRAPGAVEPRVTLNFPTLRNAGLILLHIEGEAKLRALRAAEQPGPVEDMPIRAFLRGDRPLETFWRA